MSSTRHATTDLDWARGVSLDRINTIGTARLMIRFLREELTRRDVAAAPPAHPAPTENTEE